MELEQILDNLQEQCNQLYEKYGASEEVIDLQVTINKLRNHYNISDKTQIKKRFVFLNVR